VIVELYGVLVTYQRPDALAYSLQHIQTQRPRQLKKLVVVDNEPSEATHKLISDYRDRGNEVDYLPAQDNIGPAGARTLGSKHLLADASDEDWVVFFDDRKALPRPSILSELSDFAEQMLAHDPATAGIGLAGARIDLRRLRVQMPADHELTGPIRVDTLYSNRFPTFRVAVIRKYGSDDPRFFWGWEDTEYCLRLGDHGYKLYMDGALWNELRGKVSTRGFQHVRFRVEEPDPRRYYSLRNLIRILLERGHYLAALRLAVVSGLGKPLVNIPRAPRLSMSNLRLNAGALRDGTIGRMGRTRPMHARRDAIRIFETE
jgi:glycosyltransferase involved in cell wall biosynthesis